MGGKFHPPSQVYIAFSATSSFSIHLVEQNLNFQSKSNLNVHPQPKMNKNLAINSLNAKVAIIQKPVNWFAEQINSI